MSGQMGFGMLILSAIVALVLIGMGYLVVVPLVLVVVMANGFAVLSVLSILALPSVWLTRGGHVVTPGLLRALSWIPRIWLWGYDGAFLFGGLPRHPHQWMQSLMPRGPLSFDQRFFAICAAGFLRGGYDAIWMPLRWSGWDKPLPSLGDFPHGILAMVMVWVRYDLAVGIPALAVVLGEWLLYRGWRAIRGMKRAVLDPVGAAAAAKEGRAVHR